VTIVPGLVFVSERESGPWIDCATSSGAMLAHYADPAVPATLATAHAIRAAVPLPHSGGLTPSQLARGLAREFPHLAPTGKRAERADVPDLLRAGYAVAVPLTYGELPERLRRWQPRFTGGHSVTLAGVNTAGRFGWFDPLGTAGWSGEWVTWADVERAIWTQRGAIIAAPKAAPHQLMLPEPGVATPPEGTALRYGGTSSNRGRYIVKADGSRVRERPSTAARVLRELRRGDTFACGQTTRTGSPVDGSRVWHGTRDGTRWIHASLVTASGHTTGREDIR
jgi:hypothetical protein